MESLLGSKPNNHSLLRREPDPGKRELQLECERSSIPLANLAKGGLLDHQWMLRKPMLKAIRKPRNHLPPILLDTWIEHGVEYRVERFSTGRDEFLSVTTRHPLSTAVIDTRVIKIKDSEAEYVPQGREIPPDSRGPMVT